MLYKIKRLKNVTDDHYNNFFIIDLNSNNDIYS